MFLQELSVVGKTGQIVGFNIMEGMAFFLMLFVFSAVVSAAIVLWYPFRLFLRQGLGEAASIVGATMGWLVLFMGVALVVLAFVR